MSFRYRLLPSGKWEVLRSDDMVMAVFGTPREARDYCQRKNAEAGSMQ